MSDRVFEKFADLDRRLIDAAKKIRVLSLLAWPAEHGDEFLRGYSRGAAKLPTVTYPKFEYSKEKQEFYDIAVRSDPGHPIGRYLQQSSLSYLYAVKMLESVGTDGFVEISKFLYGTPHEKISTHTNLSFAEELISATSEFAAILEPGEREHYLEPTRVVGILESRINEFFGDSIVKVVLDEGLLSKAAAGAERIRVRSLSNFTSSELQQLIEHELFVHSATALNGRNQPMLKSLGLGSPRTTCTQEGIATFAEMVTTSMDLSRLRRIALRIKGIDIALEGADFIDVFKFFLESGQSEKESFQSTSRIFRGGDVRGGIAFTKDVVYLKGLFLVHTFLRKSIERRKLNYCGSTSAAIVCGDGSKKKLYKSTGDDFSELTLTGVKNVTPDTKAKLASNNQSADLAYFTTSTEATYAPFPNAAMVTNGTVTALFPDGMALQGN